MTDVTPGDLSHSMVDGDLCVIPFDCDNMTQWMCRPNHFAHLEYI